jgi:hypothetical protein
MTCPYCSATVPPRTAICEGCLHVVDDSLLDPPAPVVKVEGPLTDLYAAAQPSASVLQAVDELRSQWRRMKPAERWTVRGAVASLVSLGLPWHWTVESEELIGYVAGGWPVALLALVAALALFARDDERLAPHRGRLGGLAVGVSSLAVLACVLFLRTSFRSDLLRSGGRLHLHVLERPMFGAWLGLCAAVVMLGGALLSWRARPGR